MNQRRGLTAIEVTERPIKSVRTGCAATSAPDPELTSTGRGLEPSER